jgi:hypothetical protein
LSHALRPRLPSSGVPSCLFTENFLIVILYDSIETWTDSASTIMVLSSTPGNCEVIFEVQDEIQSINGALALGPSRGPRAGIYIAR